MNMSDFRKEFKDFDDAALITLDEYAELLHITQTAAAQKRHAGDLAAPCIQGGKLLRWRAGDVRAWLSGLQQDRRPDPAQGASKRLGRPRNQLSTKLQLIATVPE